jgi:hypothetical protein
MASQAGRFRKRSNKGRSYKKFNSGTNNNKPKSNNIQTAEKKLSDYQYVLGHSNLTTNDVNQVTRQLLDHINGRFGTDVRSAIENRTPFNFEAVVPTKQVSTSPDDAIKEAEEDIFTAIYKTDLSAWGKRKELYRSNLGKAYTFIWQYCSIILQNKIQARQDFAQTIQDDPIALMSAIEEHALNMMEAWRNLGQIRQHDDEGVIEYAERFKTVRVLQ